MFRSPGFSRCMLAGTVASCWERLIRLMNVAHIVRICMTRSPGFSRWNVCRDRAYCRECLIRLMNVAHIVRICMTGSPGFSRCMLAGTVASCRERLIRLQPGLPIADVRMNSSKFICRITLSARSTRSAFSAEDTADKPPGSEWLSKDRWAHGQVGHQRCFPPPDRSGR